MIVDRSGAVIHVSKAVSVRDVSTKEQELIRAYLQGAVYAWCNSMKDKEFRFATFAGGENFYWEDTVLYPLYVNQTHGNQTVDQDSAMKQAAINGGLLLKQVLVADKRKFKTWKVLNPNGYEVSVYAWDK